jgi:protoheme IX farnesyltransferase
MMQIKVVEKLTLFAHLTKFKLSLAVAFSSVAGYYLYKNSITINLLFLFTGVFLMATGSAILNQYTERMADSLMKRTKNRPIPLKQITATQALLFASVSFTTGSILLYNNGIIPFILGIFTVLLYNLIYTSLKKKSLFSIIPGALVGAIPPMIGYSSAGGTLTDINLIAFATFMFLWQLPHFWLIVIKYGNEYKKAGFETICKYLSTNQIRKLVFAWVMLSSVLLFVFFHYTAAFSKGIFGLFLILNISFILLFYHTLFKSKDAYDIKWPFILINSFSLIIMLLIITASILNVTI